jgi:adenylate cyclase
MTALPRFVFGTIAICGSIILGAALGAWFAGPSLDLLLSTRHALWGDRHQISDSRVAVVAIDEETLARADLKDLPLALWGPQLGTTVASLQNANAAVIGFDIILGTTAESVAPGHDRTLLSAMRTAAKSHKLVLADAMVGGRQFEPYPLFAIVAGGAKNIRSVNVTPDFDGIVRSIPLTFERRQEEQPIGVPGMALELAMRADAGATAAGSSIVLNFADRAPAPIYSLGDVLDCASSNATGSLAAAFSGRVVLIGSVLDLEDRKAVSGRSFIDPALGRTKLPCSQNTAVRAGASRTTIPGVLIHAQAINDLLRHEILRPSGTAITGFCLLLLAGTGTAIAARANANLGPALTLAAAFVWSAAALLVISYDLILPYIGGITALACGYFAMLAYRSLVIDAERKRSVAALSRYLDPELAQSLLSSPKPPELGGEIKDVTVWFSDIANFSTIAEKIEPRELVERLNQHFAMVAELIEREGGIIDKFIGDAVVAVFGAPTPLHDHAARAVRAACNVVAAVRAAPEAHGAFSMRIGLNTGPALVGNVGSKRRFDYTAIGDTVNLAQRLEQANKELDTTLLIAATTAKAAGTIEGLTPLGSVAIKGRIAVVDVYTIRQSSSASAQTDP